MLTEEEYKIIDDRLANGEKQLDGHWNDPRYKKWIDKFNQLMEDKLEYEHEHKLDWAKDHICKK